MSANTNTTQSYSGCDFDLVYKLFLATIQDYHIKDLFNEDIDVAEDLLLVFLLRAIPKFKNCIKDISNIDTELKTFGVTLDLDEINILSDLMVLSWLDWNNNNVIQMNLTLNDSDYKHFSEEKNLREKTMYADRLREKVQQDMTEYGFKHTSFKDWAAGNYGI